ncbi:MAG: glycosyltransferase [Planctomycetia bacterium]|nr:glycosyltransferase [Planctomycetia bacterium]
MRVLLFHPWGRFDSACCGASHTALAHLEFFQHSGWEVHCVLQEIPAWCVTAPEPTELLSHFSCVKSVRTLRIDCPPISPRDYGDEFRQLLYASEGAARGRAFRAIASERWDAFLTTDVTCSAYALGVPRSTFKVLAAGDSYARRATVTELASPEVRVSESNFTFARVECELYRLFDRVLFPSEAQTREAAQRGVKSAVHVPTRIREVGTPPEPNAEHDIVICGGSRTSDLADVEWFYRHIYVPHLRGCGIRLTLAGPVAERFAVIDQRVTKLSSTRGAYRAARVVVTPIYEAAGPHVPVMDALAAGCALVTTPCGLHGLEIQENAAVVLEMRNDPGCVAAGIRDLLAAPGWRKVLGERAARSASRHTRERHFSALGAAWHLAMERLQNVMERS